MTWSQGQQEAGSAGDVQGMVGTRGWVNRRFRTDSLGILQKQGQSQREFQSTGYQVQYLKI